MAGGDAGGAVQFVSVYDIYSGQGGAGGGDNMQQQQQQAHRQGAQTISAVGDPSVTQAGSNAAWVSQ